MANRRMFSQRITNSARFQQMSPSAQALYFHLGMAADDDGVVEAFMVMRTVKAMEDDFRVLIAKKFIIPLNEEQVSYILDWNEHNLIRADRLTPSMYRELLVRVIPDIELTQPTIRADLKRLPGRPMDNQRTAQDRVGKGSIHTSVADAPQVVEVSEEEPKLKKDREYLKVFALFKRQQKSWERNRTQIKAATALLEERGLEAVKDALEWYESNRHIDFIPEVHSPYDLDTKWAKLESFNDKIHG